MSELDTINAKIRRLTSEAVKLGVDASSATLDMLAGHPASDERTECARAVFYSLHQSRKCAEALPDADDLLALDGMDTRLPELIDAALDLVR